MAQDLAWDLPWEHSANLQLSCNLWESLLCPSHLPCPTPASSKLDVSLCPLGWWQPLDGCSCTAQLLWGRAEKSTSSSDQQAQASSSETWTDFILQAVEHKDNEKKKSVCGVENKADEGYRFVCSTQLMMYLNNIASVLKIQLFYFKSKPHLWIYSCWS